MRAWAGEPGTDGLLIPPPSRCRRVDDITSDTIVVVAITGKQGAGMAGYRTDSTCDSGGLKEERPSSPS